jgi:hypothetical protein
MTATFPAPLVPTFPVGTRVVSVRGVAGGSYSYVAPAIYEAVARKSDGVVTWRFVEAPCGTFMTRHGRRLAVGFRSVAKAERIAEEVADDLGIAFLDGIRHGMAV